ncbi:MAG: hypothetical protein ACKV2U_06310 [Bryobacteraceae bacterium]
MPYRFAASTTGPLAEIAGSLALPAALQFNSEDPHHVWALVDNDRPSGLQNAWAILPVAAAAAKELFRPRFDSVDDWLPGMTALMERRVDFRANATAEVSALWTSLAAPLKTAITGDIGLDLDLGLQAQAQWQVSSDCWWSIQRPDAARLLRLRLCAARSSARSISVKAGAVANLDQATRNALAAILGQHRTQLLHQLRQGVYGMLGKLPASKKKVGDFLEKWLTLPAETQAEQWRNPADPLLAALKTVVDGAVDNTLAHADQLTARLEYAAVRALEKSVEVSLTAIFDKRRSSDAILDADFDFDANPGLEALYRQALDGDLTPLLAQPVAGLTLRRCTIAEEIARRQTFAWRLPFSSGFVSSQERLQTAMEALDDETGRVVRGYVKAESERRTRHASSLLSIEGAFAAHLGAEVTVHDPASLNARFELNFRTNRPLALQPLLDLYGAGPAERHATACRIEIALPPESIAHWLEPQDPAVVSRRMQTVWRTLLPLTVDMDSLNNQAAAPLLVWASLPVTTEARRTARGVELNRRGGLYWDWADPQLLQAMVWNPRTRSALEARLEQTHLTATADEMRRAVSQPVGAAVFSSLLRTEAQFIDRLTSHLGHRIANPRNPVETMRNMSFMLSGMASAFHTKLTSVYGPEAARALGPLLLSAASPHKPEVKVTWSR